MDKIKTLLSEYGDKEVLLYINYLHKLKTEEKNGKLLNWWFGNISQKQFADAFVKVKQQSLTIDGDTVTLSYRKNTGLVIQYDYHAYKNKVQIIYPDAIFDFSLVYENDNFKFKKESGKITYTHEYKDPFNNDKIIKGAYGIVKCKRGEFVEFLTLKDIEKMRNTSQTRAIWDTWYDRMVLKSVIKRICSVHFKDITGDMDKSDNEVNEPNYALIDAKIQDEIQNACSNNELKEIHTKYKDEVPNVKVFNSLLKKRQSEFISIEKQLGEILAKLDDNKKADYLLRITTAQESNEDTVTFYQNLINELT